ncbi:MAG: hypothetical protein HY370_02315 [Proteobacteria bacterium]|nr:hypothetical protein [Pseudomonadota bacterium]
MTGFIIKHWKIFGAGLLVLILSTTLAWQSHRIASLKQERDDARTSLATYQAALDGLRADAAAKIGALEAESGRQTARAQNLQRLLGQIEGASDEKNGIVAPVLRDAIDRLYGADAAGEAH